MAGEDDRAKKFVITRTFKAPRAIVWQAWTEEERLAKWWGPKGFTWVKSALDLRLDGMFHYGMKAPDGNVMWGKFVYDEICPPERMVFRSSFSDENGGTVRAFFAADFPLEVRNEVSFVEHANETTVILEGGPVNASAAEEAFFAGMFASMQQGFGGTFDQLDAYLHEG